MSQLLKPDIESSSADYARRFSGPVGSYFLRRQLQIVISMLKMLPAGPLKVLEVGGGHAQITPLLLALGHEVTVHGSEPICFERISRIESEKGITIPRLVSPLPGLLPVDDKSFDLVIGIRLMAHLDKWQDFLSDLMRIAKVGVIVDYAPIFGWNALTPILYQIKKRLEGNTRPYLCQSDAAVARQFEKNGFSVKSLQKQFALPMGAHRAFQRPKLSALAETTLLRCGIAGLIGSPALLLATPQN